MKHFVLLLWFAITAFFISPFTAKAQDIPNEDGEEIEITITNNTPDNGPKRTPAVIPFTAYYYASISCVELCFLDIIGEVTVTMTNLATGYSSNFLVDSTNGSTFLPVPDYSGLWQILFVTEGGSNYSGYFIK